MNNEENMDDCIAVVGMSGRFPGATTIRKFWQNLRDGVESMTNLSDEDVRHFFRQLDPLSAKYAMRQANDANYVKAGFFVDNVEEFDASFFGFNPSELELIDPQHRLFLETSWEAFEDAGYDPLTFEGRVGVYAGTVMSRYLLFNIFSNRSIMYSERDFLAGIGNEVDYLPTRVSYKLNLKGPSVSVQTACSTSLVAIHLGCQALLNGECDMALAGGSVLQVPHKQGYLYQEGSMVSPDGHCRAFDAQAKGTVFSAGGAGTVLLKRLSDALADGDHIYSVVRSSAINNDGSAKVGFTAPGVDGQVAAVTEALEVANIDPASVSYIEAHGTGTPLGDPIEIESLTRAYRNFTQEKQFCGIGSVKTNIGHLAAAAGVASFIKVSLAMKHRQLPPTLNYTSPNPRIDFANSPFYVNTSLSEWQGVEGIRRAGVSSFGVGGTNAHAILEQAPSIAPSDSGRSWQLLSLSAKSPEALTDQIRQLADFLAEDETQVCLADLSYTLHRGRHPFEHRFSCVAKNREQAISALRGGLPQLSVTGSPLTDTSTAVFMFSGQGSQYVNMGRELYEHESLFRTQVDLCSNILQPYAGWLLTDILYPEAGEEAWASERLRQTDVTQPALFVVEYALAQLLLSWGIVPEAMIGHSIGEWVAACIADVMDVEDALRLVARRGSLMHAQPSGAMLSIRMGEAEVEQLLGDELSLAAVNAPEFCVVSGTQNAINALAAKNLPTQLLHTSHAFHSSMMEPVLDPLMAAFAGVELRAPKRPYLSNVTGTWITPSQATDPAYWAAQLRGSVRFSAGIETLTEQPGRVFIEVGPGTALTGLARQSFGTNTQALAVSCMHHPKDSHSAQGFLLSALGRMWAAGLTPDWNKFYAGQRRLRVSAPTYPFQRRRFWLESNQETFGDLQTLAGDKQPLDQWFYQPSWSRSIAPLARLQDKSSTLVFHGARYFDHGLLSALAHAEQRVCSVYCSPGVEFAEVNNGYQMDAAQPEHYLQLLRLSEKRGQVPQTIVHTLAVQEAGHTDSLGELNQLQNDSFYSLIFLAQAIGETVPDQSLELNVITSGLAEVNGTETLVPEQAAILGPCKVIPLEYTNMACRVIDLSLDEVRDPELPALLVDEMRSDPEPFVAYRHGWRWLQTFEPEEFPETNSDIRPDLLTDNGVYLITGGLGGLGLVHAERLARHGPVKLALLGRSGLPEPALWNNLLAELPTDDAVRQAIIQVKNIQALGSEVMAIRADITDLAQMQIAVTTVRQRFGRINGIIHCAGVAGGGLIQLKTTVAAEKVFSAKISGTLVLEQVTADEPLDFVVLSSSLFAVTGGIGQVDYCGANNFLDVFACAKRFAHARQVISVNWDAWDQVGMARSMLTKLQGDSTETSEWQRLDQTVLHQRQLEGLQRRYLTRLHPDQDWFLTDHKIMGQPTVPGTYYLEMARAAFADAENVDAVALQNVYFMRPMHLQPGVPQDVRLSLTPEGPHHSFTIESKTDHGWQTHASGQVRALQAAVNPVGNLDQIKRRCTSHVSQPSWVAESADEPPFIQFGSRWQNLKAIYIGQGEALAELALDAEFLEDLQHFVLHPALLDIATGPASGYAVPEEALQDDAPFLPFTYGSLQVFKPIAGAIYSHIRHTPKSSDDQNTITLSIDLLDREGQLLVRVSDFSLRKVNASTMGQIEATTEAAFSDDSLAILPREGAEAFSRILTYPRASQIIVSTIELNYLLKHTRSGQEPLGEGSNTDAVHRAAHTRPDLETPYVEPLGALESSLAKIWQTVLGIEKVGRNDNFFELGADSVLGVQVVSKAREAGILLNPSQLFDYQSIAELATVAQTDRDSQGSITLPLTPAARSIGAPYPLFSVRLPSGTTSEQVINACQQLVQATECLQLHQQDGQLLVNPSATPAIALVDTTIDADEDTLMAALVQGLNEGTNTAFSVAYGADVLAPKVTLMAHPLLCDLRSMQWFKEALLQIVSSSTAVQVDASRNLSRWVTQVQKYCDTPEAQRRLDEWQTHVNAANKVSWPQENLLTGALDVVVQTLDSARTEALLRASNQGYQTQPEELLLAAVAHTLGEWGNHSRVMLDLVTDGRELPGLEGDWSQVLGNLDITYPACFEFNHALQDHDYLIRTIKDQVRDSYRFALAYGWKNSGVHCSAFRFHYCPHTQNTQGNPLAVHHANDTLAPYVLSLSCTHSNNKLHFTWHFDSAKVTRNTVTELSMKTLHHIEQLLAHTESLHGTTFTPSDFPEAGLDQEMLDSLVGELMQETSDE